MKFPLDFEGYKEDILLKINDVQLKNYVNLILFNEEVDDKATNLLINILYVILIYMITNKISKKFKIEKVY